MKTRAHKKIDLLLGIAPAVVAEPGVTVAELSRLFGVKKKEIHYAVQSLSLIGIPPFSPDDFLDFWIEEGKVMCAAPLSFHRPLKLNLIEAISVILAAKLLRLDELDAPGYRIWRSTLEKLSRAIGDTGLKNHLELESLIEIDSGPADAEHYISTWVKARESAKLAETTYFEPASDRQVTAMLTAGGVFGGGGGYQLCAIDENGAELRIDIRRVRRVKLTDLPAAGEIKPPPAKSKGEEPPRSTRAVVRTTDPVILQRFEHAIMSELENKEVLATVEIPANEIDKFVRTAIAHFDNFKIDGPPELKKIIAAEARAMIVKLID